MDNWSAQKTNNDQGADFREISINGKISELQFTIKPNSDFWRAGFKLFDPNDTIFPLRSSNSLLFHLGSTPSNEKYGFTAYRNGKWVKELNKTKKYPDDRLITIRLEINHNNFLKVYVNGSLEFRPVWHLENPNIREKAVLIAWGDQNNYNVNFKSITVADWKTIRGKTHKQSLNQRPHSRKNSFVKTKISSNSNRATKAHRILHAPLYKIIGLFVAIISIPWWPNIFRYLLNNQSNNLTNQQTVTLMPTPTPSKQGFLRRLDPLETGKKIGELPNGVYFFAHPQAIQYEVEDPKVDFLEATRIDSYYNFELQKIENRYYIIGFISDESYSNIGSIKEKSIYTILFPNRWGGSTHVVAIPIDAIYTIRSRFIDLDESKSVNIFDIGFREVVDNPDIHKEKAL